MSNITKEEQGKKVQPEKNNVKKQNKKRTNYKYLPCWNLNKWKGDQHSIQKYHNFIYQMASVGSCSGLHSYKETLIDRISIFFFLPFIHDYHLQSQLSNAQCTAAYDLFLAVQALWTIFFFSHYKTTILFTYFQVFFFFSNFIVLHSIDSIHTS